MTLSLCHRQSLLLLNFFPPGRITLDNFHCTRSQARVTPCLQPRLVCTNAQTHTQVYVGRWKAVWSHPRIDHPLLDWSWRFSLPRWRAKDWDLDTRLTVTLLCRIFPQRRPLLLDGRERPVINGSWWNNLGEKTSNRQLHHFSMCIKSRECSDVRNKPPSVLRPGRPWAAGWRREQRGADREHLCPCGFSSSQVCSAAEIIPHVARSYSFYSCQAKLVHQKFLNRNLKTMVL